MAPLGALEQARVKRLEAERDDATDAFTRRPERHLNTLLCRNLNFLFHVFRTLVELGDHLGTADMFNCDEKGPERIAALESQ